MSELFLCGKEGAFTDEGRQAVTFEQSVALAASQTLGFGSFRRWVSHELLGLSASHLVTFPISASAIRNVSFRPESRFDVAVLLC